MQGDMLIIVRLLIQQDASQHSKSEQHGLPK